MYRNKTIVGSSYHIATPTNFTEKQLLLIKWHIGVIIYLFSKIVKWHREYIDKNSLAPNHPSEKMEQSNWRDAANVAVYESCPLPPRTKGQ